MHRYLAIINRIKEKPIVLFSANRYFGYSLQFARGILVAKILGPYLFGIWGFLMLLQQYLSYTSVGIEYAINVELAVDSISDTKRRTKYIGVALTLMFFIALFIALFGLAIQYYGLFVFEKFAFSQYAFILTLIVGLANLKTILTNVYRYYGSLWRIMISELILAVVPLLVILIFRGETLIMALLIAIGVSNFAALILLAFKAPFPISIQIDIYAVYQLMKVGIPLLIYNLSFALIIISGRTIVSIFYPVETMGLFSLANSITTVTLLGLQSIIWVVLPRLLTKTRYGLPDDEVNSLVNKVNELYSTSVFLAVFSMILLAPLLFLVLPQYENVMSILVILLLTQALFSTPFGYNTLAVARKQQLRVAGIAVIAMIFVVLFGGLVAWFQWDAVWVAVAMLGGGLIYAVLQARLGARLVNRNTLPSGYLAGVLPLGSLVAAAFFLVGNFMGYHLLFGGLGMVVFLFSRRQAIHRLYSFAANEFSVRGSR